MGARLDRHLAAGRCLLEMRGDLAVIVALVAIERFAPGGHPTTLPNPGVYARHNAVDVPARLPDGSGSELSVSAILQVRPVPDDRSREEHGQGEERP